MALGRDVAAMLVSRYAKALRKLGVCSPLSSCPHLCHVQRSEDLAQYLPTQVHAF